MNTLQQKIEALLFYKNEPVSFSWLAKKLGIKQSEISANLIEMIPLYENRGLALVITDDQASLLTGEIAAEIIAGLSKNSEERELSKQALETLSIILYKKKINKSELDYIRGVNSVFILRNLLIRGLIQKNINPVDKRSPLYTVTHDTLSFLGIQKISDLPQFEQFSKKLNELEQDYKTEQEEDLVIEKSIQNNSTKTDHL